jgi:LysM repeat protein
MVYRSPVRWLAPLALVAAAIAVYLVASGGGGGGGGGGEANPSSAPIRTTSPKPRAPARRAYVVQPGDVLSQIAVKTGVPLEEIQRLNPTVEAQSLHAGQRIRLSP